MPAHDCLPDRPASSTPRRMRSPRGRSLLAALVGCTSATTKPKTEVKPDVVKPDVQPDVVKPDVQPDGDNVVINFGKSDPQSTKEPKDKKKGRLSGSWMPTSRQDSAGSKGSDSSGGGSDKKKPDKKLDKTLDRKKSGTSSGSTSGPSGGTMLTFPPFAEVATAFAKVRGVYDLCATALKATEANTEGTLTMLGKLVESMPNHETMSDTLMSEGHKRGGSVGGCYFDAYGILLVTNHHFDRAKELAMKIQQELPSKPSASELKKLQGEVDIARVEATKRFDEELASLRKMNADCMLESDQDKAAATTTTTTTTPEIKVKSESKHKPREGKPSSGDKPKRKGKSLDQRSPLDDAPTGDSATIPLTTG